MWTEPKLVCLCFGKRVLCKYYKQGFSLILKMLMHADGQQYSEKSSSHQRSSDSPCPEAININFLGIFLGICVCIQRIHIYHSHTFLSYKQKHTARILCYFLIYQYIRNHSVSAHLIYFHPNGCIMVSLQG